jgi:hypothetical protein
VRLWAFEPGKGRGGSGLGESGLVWAQKFVTKPLGFFLGEKKLGKANGAIFFALHRVKIIRITNFDIFLAIAMVVFFVLMM